MKITRNKSSIKCDDMIETITEDVLDREIENPTDVEEMTDMVVVEAECLHKAHLCIMDAIDNLSNCPDNELAREAIANLSVVAFSLE